MSAPVQQSLQQPAEALLKLATEIHENENLRKMAAGQGLDILDVAWEDTARSKNSCWGPNITDMTLRVGNYPMPIIRQPNFADVTADIPIEHFNVTVGNETVGAAKQRIPLREYIDELGKWAGIATPQKYLLERDSRILTSAQCCVLPLRDGKVEFSIEMFNYQSTRDYPAVLVIIATTAGTSTQVIGYGGKVFFNKAGRACKFMIARSQDFVVERLAELKKEKPNEAPEVLEKMARAEALERGCIQIFQIPLTHRNTPVPQYATFMSTAYGDDDDGGSLGIIDKKAPVQRGGGKPAAALPHRGVEAGVVQEGPDVGQWPTFSPKAKYWERDERYPIRATIQFYTVTDTQDIGEQVFKEFAGKIRDVFSYGSHQGSLVTATSNRVTESSSATSPAAEVLAASPIGPWASAKP
jgi:hypothetical protein